MDGVDDQAGWTECPLVKAPADRPHAWIASVTDATRSAGHQMLQQITASFPEGLEEVAELVNARTGGRFRMELGASRE